MLTFAKNFLANSITTFKTKQFHLKVSIFKRIDRNLLVIMLVITYNLFFSVFDICDDEEISGEKGVLISPHYLNVLYTTNLDCNKTISPPYGKVNV